MSAARFMLAACVIAGTATIQAETIRVPSDYPNIQGALWLAAEGDTVLVAGGTYSGPGNREIGFEGIDLVLLSEEGAGATVIDCEGGGFGVSFHSGESSASILEGFEIRGAGNGIRCIGASPAIRGCHLTGHETGAGAGIYCKFASPAVTDCRITGNVATSSGGGVYCYEASPILTDCTISQNSANSSGGGIYCYEASPILTACAISENSAGSRGGATYMRYSSPVFAGCTISENSADYDGGGIYATNSDPIFDDCLVIRNRSDAGGGLYLWAGSSVLTGCTIATNAAYDEGGAIYNAFQNTQAMDKCTIVGNTASIGGAIYVRGGTPTLTNSILWANAPREIDIYSGAPLVTYSDIEGGWPGKGNIDADPLFCDVVCGAFDDLGLAADSPCLGAGFAGADMGAWGEACALPIEPPEALVLEVPAQYATIGAALSDACDNDTILIAPGTYVESDLEVPGLGIVLTGWDPRDPDIVSATVIDGAGATVIRFLPNRSSRKCTLAGLTITGGGTGIECHGASPTIEYCTISGNNSEYRGAGLHCSYSSPALNHCTISDNTTTGSGGGLYCSDDSSPILDRCTLERNSAQGEGGALYCSSSDPILIRCTLVGNEARGNGGGIYCSSSDPILTNCTLSANAAEGEGGGIYGNTSPVTLTNCTLNDNSAGGRGGGLRCYSSSPATLTNCTLSGNSAGLPGGALSHSYSSTPWLTNCILWADSPNEIEGAATATYCDIQGGWTGEGNIDANPGFRFVGGFDYLLRLGSPCIDTGDPTIEDGISDRHPRWPDWYHDGPRSDMGAYGGPGNIGWLP